MVTKVSVYWEFRFTSVFQGFEAGYQACVVSLV